MRKLQSPDLMNVGVEHTMTVLYDKREWPLEQQGDGTLKSHELVVHEV